MRLLNGSKLRVPFEGFQQFHCLLIHNMANGLPINLLQRPGRDQRSRVDFPKNLLPGMWGRTRAADGVLLRSGSRARLRGRLRHVPRPLKEYRFDQDGIGRARMPGLPNRQCFRASGAVLVGTKGTCNSVRSGGCNRRCAKEASKMGRGSSRPIEVNMEEFLAIGFGRPRQPYRHQFRFRSPGDCPLRPGQTEW